MCEFKKRIISLKTWCFNTHQQKGLFHLQRPKVSVRLSKTFFPDILRGEKYLLDKKKRGRKLSVN